MSIIQIFVRLIHEGHRKLDSVPDHIREEVAAALEKGTGQH